MPAKPGFPVSLYVEDLAKNLECFTRILGFREVERFEAPGGEPLHALLVFGRGPGAAGVSLVAIPAMAGHDGYDLGEFRANLRRGALGNGVVFDFVVRDVDRYFRGIAARGAMIDEAPTDPFWGERTIRVRTPDAYSLAFAQRIPGHRTAKEHGRFVRPPRRRAAAPRRRRA